MNLTVLLTVRTHQEMIIGDKIKISIRLKSSELDLKWLKDHQPSTDISSNRSQCNKDNSAMVMGSDKLWTNSKSSKKRKTRDSKSFSTKWEVSKLTNSMALQTFSIEWFLTALNWKVSTISSLVKTELSLIKTQCSKKRLESTKSGLDKLWASNHGNSNSTLKLIKMRELLNTLSKSTKRTRICK